MLLYCLGLPIPGDVEGNLPAELFDESTLRKVPVRDGETTQVRVAEQGDGDQEYTLSPEDEAEIAKRLRALGYIE